MTVLSDLWLTKKFLYLEAQRSNYVFVSHELFSFCSRTKSFDQDNLFDDFFINYYYLANKENVFLEINQECKEPFNSKGVY